MHDGRGQVAHGHTANWIMQLGPDVVRMQTLVLDCSGQGEIATRAIRDVVG